MEARQSAIASNLSKAIAGPLAAGSTAALRESESYTLTVITGDRRKGTKAMATGTGRATSFTKPFDNVGRKTFYDYNALCEPVYLHRNAFRLFNTG